MRASLHFRTDGTVLFETPPSRGRRRHLRSIGPRWTGNWDIAPKTPLRRPEPTGGGQSESPLLRLPLHRSFPSPGRSTLRAGDHPGEPSRSFVRHFPMDRLFRPGAPDGRRVPSLHSHCIARAGACTNGTTGNDLPPVVHSRSLPI